LVDQLPPDDARLNPYQLGACIHLYDAVEALEAQDDAFGCLSAAERAGAGAAGDQWDAGLARAQDELSQFGRVLRRHRPDEAVIARSESLAKGFPQLQPEVRAIHPIHFQSAPPDGCKQRINSSDMC